jgi:hypothetical protein
MTMETTRCDALISSAARTHNHPGTYGCSAIASAARGASVRVAGASAGAAREPDPAAIADGLSTGSVTAALIRIVSKVINICSEHCQVLSSNWARLRAFIISMGVPDGAQRNLLRWTSIPG